MCYQLSLFERFRRNGLGTCGHPVLPPIGAGLIQPVKMVLVGSSR